MLLSEGISRVLDRVGLSTSTTAYKDKARNYLNMMRDELIPEADWWFLDRTTTFSTVASTREYQPVSGHVSWWHSFTDETNNRTLEIVGPDWIDSVDADKDETGTVHKVYVSGADATTGYPVIALYRIPSAVSTIRVRYRIAYTDWTSTDDASDLQTLGIGMKPFESSMIYGAASLYMEDEGDSHGAQVEAGNLDRTLQAAKRQNLRMQGNRRHLPPSANNNKVLSYGTGLAVKL